MNDNNSKSERGEDETVMIINEIRVKLNLWHASTYTQFIQQREANWFNENSSAIMKTQMTIRNFIIA